MAVKEFDEFVSRQQMGRFEEALTNWNQMRDEWLKHLDTLYARIETLLSQYTSSGKIHIRYKTIDLNEEDIGSYEARQMVLRIGRQEVDLMPIGTRFIGFKGRVDAIGSAGKASMVLAEKDWQSTLPKVHLSSPIAGPMQRKLMKIRNEHTADSELVVSPVQPHWVWKIMPRPPFRQLSELTEESLFQLIMEVSNG